MSEVIEQAMEIHRKAMNFSEKAQIAKVKKGNETDVFNFFKQAFQLEREAAMLLKDEEEDLVTRAVLFRSAAVLALDCNEHHEAEKLIALGLSAETPPQIAEELRDLFEEANFERHMDLRGRSLLPGQIRASFTGNSIRSGLGEASPVIFRIHVLKKMLLRTAERLQGSPFRRGEQSSKYLENFDLYMSSPQPSGLAFTFQISDIEQGNGVKGRNSKTNVISNLLECLDHFENDRVDKLKGLIDDDIYYENFIYLAGKIKPDGKKVKNVALVTEKSCVRLKAKQTKTMSLTYIPSKRGTDVEETTTVRGKILYVDATLGSSLVKIYLSNKSNASVKLHVPPQREDIVQNFWGREVLAHWRTQNKKKTLIDVTDIDEVEEEESDRRVSGL